MALCPNCKDEAEVNTAVKDMLSSFTHQSEDDDSENIRICDNCGEQF